MAFSTPLHDIIFWLISRPDPVLLGKATFKQRYFVYDKDYEAGGPLFVYFGNEDDVTLLVCSS